MKKRKILVFAHVPPPHHGQSVMVKLLIDGLRKDPRFEVHHVNAQLSNGAADIGSFRLQKLLQLLRHIVHAWRIRAAHGSVAFYYIPAPVKCSAILRDLLVMTLCRPFFREMILHWHAYGLGSWAVRERNPIGRTVQLALGGADLSIALTEHNAADAALLRPKRSVVVADGVSDPCPDFTRVVLPDRIGRCAKPPRERNIRCLFMAQCTRSKGLFDALEAFALARNAWGADGREKLSLTVAGEFVDASEETAFRRRIAEEDLRNADASPAVIHVGFLDSEAKFEALKNHDCLLVPSHWESFGLTVIEAAAFGLPTIVSKHPNLVQLLPDHLFFSAPCDKPEQFAAAIAKSFSFNKFDELRKYYLQNYQANNFVKAMAVALM
jgi:glycosyltransferase involved in cell wall biosynthesis